MSVGLWLLDAVAVRLLVLVVVGVVLALGHEGKSIPRPSLSVKFIPYPIYYYHEINALRVSFAVYICPVRVQRISPVSRTIALTVFDEYT